MSERVLRGTSATLAVVFYSDEDVAEADGAVTVTITATDGTVVVATTNTTHTPGEDTYTYVLPPQDDLNELTAVWSGTFAGQVQTITTEVEIVGGFYLTLGAIRTAKNLNDADKFPSATLRTARTWFEETFEDFTAVAWVPRYRRVTLDGWSMDGSLILPDLYVRSIRSVSCTSSAGVTTAFTSPELAGLVVDDAGILSRRSQTFWPAGTSTITVEYEHGKDRPTPDIVEAGKVAIADRVLGANAGNRQYSVATEAGIVRSSTPGPKTPFGIPFVDEVAVRRRHRVFSFG